MKKILLTNNTKLINLGDIKYDKVYTDSPFVVEFYKDAIYLDTLLDKNLDETVNNVRNKGHEVNKDIINIFFPKYKNQNIHILNIKTEFTNIYLSVIKFSKLINLYPDDEITIGVSSDELYDYESTEILDGLSNKFVNLYYLMVDLIKVKNIKLFCKKKKKSNYKDLLIGHLPLESNWFLRLADLDKKVLIFNLLKKFNLINRNKKKIYLYKKSFIIREIEPYLYDLGFNLITMPEINFTFKNSDDANSYEKIKEILDKFFDDNFLNRTFKSVVFEMYKKGIKYYSQKERHAEKYISTLDKSIKIIITNTINGFDSDIFTKQLKKNDYKIISVMHGLTQSYLNKKLISFNEAEAPDMTLCFNNSEKDMFKELMPNSLLQPISMVQEAKKKRFRFLKRFFVNKILKINEDTNIFYPSINWPYNNQTNYGLRLPDKKNYDSEKKIISLLSNVNKRAIYKNYPTRGFINSDPLINYAKSFKNIKVIDARFDFRFVSSIGDIFILGNLGTSSTISWMLGENKPIIYLSENKLKKLNHEATKMLELCFIVVNIDEDNWVETLSSILNKPYEDLVKIWKDKQIYRDQYDEDWLMGMNLHSGKLGSKYIKKFILENTK